MYKEWVSIDMQMLMTKYRRKDLATLFGTSTASINNFERKNRILATIYKEHIELLRPYLLDSLSATAHDSILRMMLLLNETQYQPGCTTCKILVQDKWMKLSGKKIIINKDKTKRG